MCIHIWMYFSVSNILWFLSNICVCVVFIVWMNASYYDNVLEVIERKSMVSSSMPRNQNLNTRWHYGIQTANWK